MTKVRISILLTFFINIVFAQEEIQNELIGKWYFCDYPVEPEEVEYKLFSKLSNQCKIDQYEFYWEFKLDGSLCVSDTLKNTQDNIIAGIIRVSSKENGWKIDNGFIIIAKQKFVIDVIDSKNLLIRRYEDD